MRPLPLGLLLVACGPGTDTDTAACEGSETSLEIGGGAAAFEPLAAGDSLPLIHGPQGGYHIELGLRATGLDATDLAAATIAGTIDGAPMANSTPWLQFRCNPETGTYDAWPTNLIYETEEPASIDGATTEVTATVTDAAGETFTTTTTLTIDDPAY